MRSLGAAFWPLAVTRELDDLILWTCAPTSWSWAPGSLGPAATAGRVLAYDAPGRGRSGEDWLASEIRHLPQADR